jgi:response regulator RpfG family c-di-GMP phosphodiesterase
MKQILIVDPDGAYRNGLNDYLIQEHFNVISVENGQEAQLALSKKNIVICLLDLDTTSHSALQVLKFVKSQKINSKIIVMYKEESSFDRIDINQTELYNLGVSEVIKKPQDKDVFNKKFSKYKNTEKEFNATPLKDTVSKGKTIGISDSLFTKLKANSLFFSKKVYIDVYIKLKNDIYCKVLHKDEPYLPERFKKYVAKFNLKDIYILKEDRSKLVQFNNYFLKKISANPKVPIEVKACLIESLLNKHFEEIYQSKIDSDTIFQTKEICQTIFDFFTDNNSAIELLKTFEAYHQDSYTHNFLTLFYIIPTMKNLDWSSETLIHQLLLAAVFQDIGKLKIPISILEKTEEEMNEVEFMEYSKHPEYSIEMLSKFVEITESMKQIIIQHHETFNGEGYPNKLKAKQTTLMSQTLSLVNDFSSILINQELSPIEALRVLYTEDYIKRYNPIILNAFTANFKKDKKRKRSLKSVA